MERPSRKTLISYFRGECSPNERELIQLYLAANSDASYVEDCLREAWPEIKSNTKISVDNVDLENFKHRFHIYKANGTLFNKPIDQAYETADTSNHNLEKNIPLNRKATRIIKLPSLIKIAAAIVLVMGSSLLIWKIVGLNPKKEQLVKHMVKIEPGSDKALLALADGKMITLSDIAVGTTMELENGVLVEKKSDGDLVYHTANIKTASQTAYNTVITPNGGQYRVTLPDGSKAFLNAGSSLKYPLSFANNERRVKMTGEVYFEIAKRTFSNGSGKKGHLPFYVETNKQEIQVLGTHFNVNAYPDETHIVTTLAEGSVRVKTENGNSVILKPGEQALVAEDISVRKVDVAVSLAWTNGDFVFKGETLQSVLRKVARWYDVETECPPELANLRFSGMISRSQSLSTIIDMLQITNKVKVTLTGRRLIVRN